MDIVNGVDVVIKDNIVLRPVKEYHTLDEILNQ